MRKILAVSLALFLSLSFVLSHGNFNETKELIESGISCNKLSEEQLDEIGDYYMEQMHPGKQHEMMHQMMGGEDSETTRLMHINMAKSIYCKENTGMMGMMGNYGSYNYSWNIYSILFLILLLGLAIIVILIIIKLLNDLTQGKRK